MSGPILVPPAAPLGRLSESTTETTPGETQTLYALRATEGDEHPRPMNLFSPAVGVELVLSDPAYAVAALSWWWACRVTGPGLC